MAPLNVLSTTDNIAISWSAPEFPPSAYVVTPVCALLCNTSLPYLFNVTIIVNSATSVTIDSLQPGSQCSITLTVQYGSAKSYVLAITEKTTSKGEYKPLMCECTCIPVQACVPYNSGLHVIV